MSPTVNPTYSKAQPWSHTGVITLPTQGGVVLEEEEQITLPGQGSPVPPTSSRALAEAHEQAIKERSRLRLLTHRDNGRGFTPAPLCNP